LSSYLESRNDARLHSIALDSLCNPLCHLERAYLAAFYHANREVVAAYEYDAWGNVVKSDTKGIAADNPFGYAGYMYDKEIGMYYLIARYYNPEHGVFLSVDPDGHWAKFNKYKWYKNKRVQYSIKSGVKEVINSYRSDVGYLMAGSKALQPIWDGGKAYVQSKNKSKWLIQQSANVIAAKGGNLSRVKSTAASKQARMAGYRLGGKALGKTILGPIGWIPGGYVFYKGFKKGWKSYKKG